MTFKELLNSDVEKTFMNVDEFSEMHVVNGKEMPVTIDNHELIERKKRVSRNENMDGIYVGQKLIYVAASDFGPLPKQGSYLTLDGLKYQVDEAVSEMGMYSITIRENKGR